MSASFKMTITGLLIRMAFATMGLMLSEQNSSDTSLNTIYIITFVIAVIFCILGVLLAFAEDGAICTIIQLAASVVILTNTEIVSEIGGIVFGILLAIGFIKVILSGEVIYIVYIFW